MTKPTQALSDLMIMVDASVRAIDELSQRPLTNITVNMIKRTGKAPRLRAKAGESRHMVPVVLYILKKLGAAAERLRADTACVSAGIT